MNWLQTIAVRKKEEVAERKRTSDFCWLREQAQNLVKVAPNRGFLSAIKRKETGPIRLIAELKVRSPVKGQFVASEKKEEILESYERSPAAAISVLTDFPFFGGDLSDLALAKEKTSKPVLRKDFIIDPFQVYEARVAGADALLLIVALLSVEQLKDLLALSNDLKMDCLVEVHDEKEAEVAQKTGAVCIGINNRDLTTFQVDLNRTAQVMQSIDKGKIIVAESGIESREQVVFLEDLGVDALLVGEALVRDGNPLRKIRELLGLDEDKGTGQ
ncbi:MAG: indole-3-glycerol phosphate synthase TrpC [Armatimonadetes bacterium]|nr:indole-3-glycerol phosphate synthase TrpC [Armatimonadota bacterium]MDW8122078.1 indole-3-glycerol phosphate synthase TrpC [Armatimonadota bacterium]